MTKLLKKATPKTSTHISIRALAGTGKTTTLCWAVQGVPEGIVLSQEQEPIIEAIQSLLQEYKRPTVRFTAFSKAIATELSSRLPPYVDTCTNHSLGLRTIKQNCGKAVKVDANKTWKICEDLRGKVFDVKGEERKYRRDLYNQTKSIVSICKATLTESEASAIAETCSFYSVDFGGNSIDLAIEVLDESARQTNWVDFDDMIWLPAVHNMMVEKVDIGIVDECQDLNAAQLWLASHSCDNLVTIGDTNQSIFGFAGADPEAIPRIEAWMKDNGTFKTFPLNETRRCGKLIVEQCHRFVPEFVAHESNQDGEVLTIEAKNLVPSLSQDFLEKKDLFVICRTNAPLTRLALQLLKERIPVQIKGRQFAQGIIRLIKSFKCETVSELLTSLDEYENIETQKLLDSNRIDADQKVIDLQDKCIIVRIFSDGCTTPECVCDKFDQLFSDENKSNVITLTSAHRSKGLEADKIYLLHPELLPHPKIAEKSEFNSIQERNISYVAFSRAKHSLIFVDSKKEQ